MTERIRRAQGGEADRLAVGTKLTPRLRDLRRLLHQTLDWFPVTVELSSTIRERLRGVLVNARLGVTGRDTAPTG